MALRLGKLRINQLWLMLGAAVVLGLLATWLTITYLRGREKAIETQLAEKAKGGPTEAVIVPTSDMPAGALIDEGAVAARDISTDLVYRDTLRIDNFDAIRGLPLLRPVQRGRPLMRDDVIDDRPKEFAAYLTKGMRAITLETDDLNSISQMLKPGNFVDLNLIAAEPGGAGSSQEVFPFLQHVKVLATGNTTSKQARRQTSGNPAEAETPFATITVEVTPEEAAYIALAQQSGKIRATLRAVDDTDVAVYPTVTTGRLIGTEARASTPGSNKPRVEYFVGGRGGGGAATPISINVPGLSPAGSPSAAAMTRNSASVALPGLPTNVAAAVNDAVNNAAVQAGNAAQHP